MADCPRIWGQALACSHKNKWVRSDPFPRISSSNRRIGPGPTLPALGLQPLNADIHSAMYAINGYRRLGADLIPKAADG